MSNENRPVGQNPTVPPDNIRPLTCSFLADEATTAQIIPDHMLKGSAIDLRNNQAALNLMFQADTSRSESLDPILRALKASVLKRTLIARARPLCWIENSQNIHGVKFITVITNFKMGAVSHTHVPIEGGEYSMIDPLNGREWSVKAMYDPHQHLLLQKRDNAEMGTNWEVRGVYKEGNELVMKARLVLMTKGGQVLKADRVLVKT